MTLTSKNTFPFLDPHPHLIPGPSENSGFPGPKTTMESSFKCHVCEKHSPVETPYEEPTGGRLNPTEYGTSGSLDFTISDLNPPPLFWGVI